MKAFYDTLLLLYPASFRREYGDELCAVFEERLAEARGVAGKIYVALEAVVDVVPNAIGAHVELLRQDLRHAARSLRHSRGFAATAVLVTALGVGANTAAFSIADFVLVRPLPFPDDESLVRLCEGPRTGGGWGCNNELSPANYRDVRNGGRSFQAMGAFTRTTTVLLGAGEPLRVPSVAVTPDVLPLLGTSPLIGRVFDVGDRADRDADAVVIGYGLWQSRFGGDTTVLGRTVNLDGSPREVIGVMPRTFQFPTRNVQMWVPLTFREEDFSSRNNSYIEGIARLQDGVTLDQARAELAVIFARLAESYPETNAETGFSFFRLRDEMSPRSRLMLTVLCGASLAMLLLTCANLANLMLARAAARERELAVRAALGAGRERLTRQLFTESAALTILGGLGGILVAVVTLPLLSALIPSTLPIASAPSLDVRVLALAMAFCALTALGFGLVPALRAGRRLEFSALREGTRAGSRRAGTRRLLVAVEVAVSVGLLACAGLLIRAVWQVQAVDPGFVASDVLTIRSELPLPRYADPARRAQFYERVLAEVRTLPGVTAAAYTSGLPMVLTGGIAEIAVPGREIRRDGSDAASVRWVSSQFFEALRIPLHRGRPIEDRDTADRALVAVVSDSFANRYWPDRDPIGQTFRVRGQDRVVVGVVGDIKVRGLERSNEPQVYMPPAQVPDGLGGLYHPKDLVVRVAGGDPPVVAVRRIVQTIDPDLPITNVRMLADVVAGETATRRAQIDVLSALAVIAVLLAGVGIYGLLGYVVAQRSREIGIRLALGARPGGIAGLVLREVLIVGIAGIVVGLTMAYGAARASSTLLFGISPSDPLTFSSAMGVGGLMIVIGSMVPAWRALRVNPLSAMRSE